MSKDAINLTKRFKEDLALIQAELNKESNSYLMSYCLYIGTVDENGELHHITGLNSLEPDNLVGRLELAQHRIMSEYYKVLDDRQTMRTDLLNSESDIDVKSILKKFVDKGKPN